MLFERGFVTSAFGPAALSYYVVAMMIGLLVHASVGSILMFLFPMMSELENDPEKIEELYKKITKLVACGVGLICALLVSYNFV